MSLIMLSGCSKTSPVITGSLEAQVERGRSVYLTNCIACHNVNPALDGSVGPKVWGIEKAVLENKVLWANIQKNIAPKEKLSL